MPDKADEIKRNVGNLLESIGIVRVPKEGTLYGKGRVRIVLRCRTSPDKNFSSDGFMYSFGITEKYYQFLKSHLSSSYVLFVCGDNDEGLPVAMYLIPADFITGSNIREYTDQKENDHKFHLNVYDGYSYVELQEENKSPKTNMCKYDHSPEDLLAKLQLLVRDYTIRPLEKYEEYTREEVHDIFSPHTDFVPQRGLWGARGLIRIPEHTGDFIFFVTYGKKQGSYTFEESITTDGILTWQSEPDQKLSHPRILQLINHNHLENSIYLFLRISRYLPYTYLGCLAYTEHDSEREQPVRFKWQILDWDISPEKIQEMGLELGESKAVIGKTKLDKPGYQLTETPPPIPKSRSGLTTVKFRGSHVNYEESGRRNKALGDAGELAVLEMERQILIGQDQVDLANNILHASKIEGDGAGYDIKSWLMWGFR